jgi:aldehyde:ferredoxin oxidoreductase
MGKILKVDLSTEKIETQSTIEYAKKYIGGRGIGARIAWEEIPKGIDAFDSRNKLIFMTGPLTGTLAPTSGRTIICSISPRIYPKPWYTHSTMGGYFGSRLKYAGFDGVIVGGKAREPMYLWIHNGEIEFLKAKNMWGIGTRATQKILKKKHGRKAQVACIGPAGEKLVRFAVISHSFEAASGHSGFGAVMGSKNLKAIVVDGDMSVDIAKPEEFLQECKYASDLTQVSPINSFLRQNKKLNSRHSLVCTQACRSSCAIGALYTDIPAKYSIGIFISEAIFCIGNCWIDGAEDTYYEGGDLRVPAGRSFGPREGVELHALCEDLGMDHWLLITIQPWLISCVNRGIKRLAGTALKPKESSWLYRLLYKIANREGLGNYLAEGLRRAVNMLKVDLPQDLVRLGETLEFAFGFPAHREGRLWDPEPFPFWVISAIMYATESRDPSIGAHAAFLHLANIFMEDPKDFLTKTKPLAKQLWGHEDALNPNFKHKVIIAIWCQHQHMINDSLPLCDFSFPRVIKPFKSRDEWRNTNNIIGDVDIGRRLLNACTGIEFSTTDLYKAAERAFNIERAILAMFGRKRLTDESIEPHFELPCRTDGTRLCKTTFKSLLDEYYMLRGWDQINGWPQRETLEKLELKDVADELEKLGR